MIYLTDRVVAIGCVGKRRIEWRKHRLDFDGDGVGTDDDITGTVAVLWGSGSSQKHSFRLDAVFCDYLCCVAAVAFGRLFSGVF